MVITISVTNLNESSLGLLRRRLELDNLLAGFNGLDSLD